MNDKVTDMLIHMIMDFTINIKSYKNATRENLINLGMFNDSFTSKISNLNDIISNLQEIEGSFITFNEKINLNTLVVDNLELFFSYIDSGLEMFVIIILTWILYILTILSCSCSSLEEFCCCFCCLCEFKSSFEWLNNKFGNRMIQNVDFIVEKRRTVYLKF